ncbi:MAG TPA: OmpA family protein, partial [bacterium]|nr:OmpA family protein [bacterium]
MRSLPIIFLLIVAFIFSFDLSCSTSKKSSTVPPAPKPKILSEKKKTPPPPPPAKEEPASFSYQTLYFDFDSAAILYRDSTHLDRLAEFLINNKEISLVIAGHADERGSFDYNLSLGEQRAIAIRSELQKRGINPERV